nr:CRM-domain containing factor CFM3A, chloroplastic/mitochondrial-like isoform X2 [Coffea arabica]
MKLIRPLFLPTHILMQRAAGNVGTTELVKSLTCGTRRFSISSLLKPSSPIFLDFRPSMQLTLRSSWLALRNFSHGRVNLVISPQGKPKFETHEIEPPKKDRWMTKKRLKMKRKKEKQKRKSANKRDPRRLGVGKKKKQRFANAEERIKYKLERAKIKEALLIERLKRYEVNKVQGPVVKPHELTGEERFYMKKMAQKRSNYVPIGRRGVFGGVILNMHLHWKKHETVKVICKPCKPGQVQDYASEIARLSGGIPIQIIGDDTIVFYRGKDYVQPEVMSPIDTLSKKRALEKSKYKQSLESVRRFIAIAEKELELYYRHVALYGDPSDRNPNSIFDTRWIEWARKVEGKEVASSITEECSHTLFQTDIDSMDDEILESEEISEFDDKCKNNAASASEIDYEDDGTHIGEIESCTKKQGLQNKLDFTDG